MLEYSEPLVSRASIPVIDTDFLSESAASAADSLSEVPTVDAIHASVLKEINNASAQLSELEITVAQMRYQLQNVMRVIEAIRGDVGAALHNIDFQLYTVTGDPRDQGTEVIRALNLRIEALEALGPAI